MTKAVSTFLCIVAAWMTAASVAHAQLIIPFVNETLPERTVLAKAPPDECFLGIGVPPLPYGANGCIQGQPKVNQAYVWGLTQTEYMSGPRYWFGTGPNIHCLVIGGFLGQTGASQNDSWVCEGGESFLVKQGLVPPALGDFRPSRSYYYDEIKGLVDLTPVIIADQQANSIRLRMIGVRAAGAADGVVFLAGPTFSITGDAQANVGFFAFDAETGALLGSFETGDYTNIRRSAAIGGALYFGVAGADGRGRVLKWVGSKASPFEFEAVGFTEGEVANIAPYGDDRIAISTWPTLLGGGVGGTFASIYISPPINGALTGADADNWSKVWDVRSYEPDPVVAAVLGGGDLAFHDGRLCWGTMVVPGLPLFATLTVDGGRTINSAEDLITAFLGSFRATTIFCGKNLETARPKIDLLYGERHLPVYDYQRGEWEMRSNASRMRPKHGRQGFDNPFNNYLWSATNVGDEMYMLTMDWQYLINGALSSVDLMNAAAGASIVSEADIASYDLPRSIRRFTSFADDILRVLLSSNPDGADVWRFDNGRGGAKPEDVSGIGNFLNYGGRNSLESEGCMIVGSANPMNLEEEGGWELIEMCPRRNGFFSWRR